MDALIVGAASAWPSLSVEIVAPPDSELDLKLEAVRCRRVGRLRGHAWEQSVLPAHAPGGLLSLCNTGPALHRVQIICIHDANTRSFPNSYRLGFRSLYRALIPALGRTASAVTTVSSFSARELRKFGICPTTPINVVPNGHEHALRWMPAHSERTRRVAGRDTIVLIGSPAPHKNIGIILNLSERLQKAGLRIVVVGAADPRVYASGMLRGDDSVEWLGRVSDEEMAALLQDCLCLVFPSLTEGFGMPPLEAMALGCPTIVSDRGSLPEVCGEASLYAPAIDPEAWFKRICDLRNSPALRNEMVARGKIRAARFRWSDAARAYLDLMTSLNGRAEQAAGKRCPDHTAGALR